MKDAETSSEQASIARREEDRTAARLRILADTSRVFAEAGRDVRAVLDTLVRIVAEHLGDPCVVRLKTPSGEHLDIVAQYHADPEALVLMREMHRGVRDTVGEGMIGGVAATGRPMFVPALDAQKVRESAPPSYHPYLDRYGVHGIIGVPLRATGRILGVVGISRDRPGAPYTPDDLELLSDLADRAALALENAQLIERLEQAVLARDEVMAILAHDLRSALSTISIGALTLRQSPAATMVAEQVPKESERILRAVRRIEELISNLLDASRIESGLFCITREPKPARALVDEAIELMVLAAGERGVELVPEIDGAGTRVDGDPLRLQQVLSNLIANAVRFTEPGGRVTVRAMPEASHVRFEVHDTGVGIAEEHLERIFERHWRGPGKSGTGLGLYIARAIVEAHGGALSVTSRVGQGSVFSFTIPAAPDAPGSDRPRT